MTPLILACVIVANQGNAKMPSLLGKWNVWRITEGDCLVDPPRLLKGGLIFNADGTYTLHTKESFFVEDGKGTYRVDGDKVSLKGTFINTVDGRRDSGGEMNDSFLYRKGLLWDGGYAFGGGSFVYGRPGASIPRKEDQWPTFTDVMENLFTNPRHSNP